MPLRLKESVRLLRPPVGKRGREVFITDLAPLIRACMEVGYIKLVVKKCR